MGFRRRRLLSLALIANAWRPPRGRFGLVPGFLGGWLTTELAPQLLAYEAADTTQLVLRRRASRSDLALAGVTLAAVGHMVWRSTTSGGLMEQSLLESLGEDYRDGLPETSLRAGVPWREVARPFRVRSREVEALRDIQYAGTGVRGRLDVLRPADGVQGAPVLVQIHGGAWITGAKDHQGQVLMNRMASRGWVCVAPNYRLAPKHPFPTQIEDVKRVLAWVREHIADYGGDPSYVVITGGSAGGHLASLAALTPGDPRWQPGFEDADTSVAACVPFYGVYDLAGADGDEPSRRMRDGFLAPKVFGRRFSEAPEDFRAASPLLRVSPEAPDFYVVHGTWDSLVPVSQARSFVRRLRETSRASVGYAELPGTHHAFETFNSIRSHHVVGAVERWLEWHRAHHHSPAADSAHADPA